MSKISRARYYEKAFERLEKEHKHTWNWAAFGFGACWLLYRKMYLYFFVWFVFWGIPHIILNATLGVDILTMILLGYYGNYFYYQTVKKKIRKGYHLLDKYAPTSIPSSLLLCLSSGIICFADYISKKLQLKNQNRNTNIDAENIRSYLNPNRKNHWIIKIANTFICFIFLFMISVPVIKYIGKRIEEQLKKEQTIATIVSNSGNAFEI